LLRLVIGLLILSQISYAFDFSIEVLQVSSSGKTILLNKGSIDTINPEDYGVLLVKSQEKDKAKDIYYDVYRPVAKLKAVKVLNNKSIWVAFKTFIPDSLNKGAKLLLLSESALLEGRTRLKINNKKLISNRNNVEDSVKETVIDDGNFLSHQKDLYYESGEMHKKEIHTDKDITLIDVNVWREKSIPGEMVFEGFYKSPYAEQFADRKRVHSFEKMVVSFMRKYNDPKFTLKDLYSEQKRSEYGDDSVQDKLLKADFFNEYQRDLDERRRRDDKFYKDLLSKGESWSDEYSDEELSELMYNVGVIREKERRNSIAAQRYDYQVYTSFGLNLINNENLQDRDNTQQSKYDLELGLEYYFLKKFESLRHFSIEASLRRAEDAFTTGTLNAVSTEYSGALHFNWYPFISPNSIETNIVYIGLTMRYGLMRAAIFSLNEQANYQVYSFPGLRGGIKYNFNNGFGARIAFGLEQLNIEREVRSFDGGELPDRVSYLEGKMSFALSKFF
jgi:hypothetical protein